MLMQTRRAPACSHISFQRHGGPFHNCGVKGIHTLTALRRNLPKRRVMPCGCAPLVADAQEQGQAARLGTELAEAGQFQQAAKAFKTHLEHHDKDAQVQEMYAQVLQELERYDEAKEAAGKAVQLQPDWPDALATYARCCLNCGAVREALQAFNTARLLTPADVSIANEAEEAADLYSRQLSLLVGLPLRLLSHAPGSVGAPGGPGSVVWDSGVLLAWYLRHCLHCRELAGAPVVELGSGMGLVGLAAAMCGARAILTDTQEVLPSLTANVAANVEEVLKAGGSATAAMFDWNSTIEGGLPASLELPSDLNCGWILGADLVYSLQQVKPLVAALSALTSAHGPSVRVLLSHKHRSDSVDEALMVSLQAAGFQAHEIPPPQGVWLEDDKFRSISLYSISCSAQSRSLCDGSSQPSFLCQDAPLAKDDSAPFAPSAPVPPPPHPPPPPQPSGIQRSAVQRSPELQTPVFAKRNVAIVGFGLPGVGKSTVLQALHGALANSVIMDKDVVNEALLGTEHAMFSEYYDRHVRIQSYRVLFKLAQAQFAAAGKSIVVILDGQFGDKLSADYIQHGLQSLPVSPLLVYFTCPADVQFSRMQERGADRDRDKYGQLDQLRQKWVMEHELEVQRWDADCASKGYKPVVRINTESSVESQVLQLLEEIAG
uniref:Uncharacterized protein n=1 Tax=Dunaliella tertiolecta TaxID=3047 RepID=A0A7S3R5U3_DUNTE